MRVDSLPSPGILSSAQSLRHHAARSISEIQIAISGGAGGGSGKTKGAAQLKAFFDACSTALAGMVELVVPVGTFARVSNSTVTFTFSEPMDQGTSGLLQAITVNTPGTITGIAWTSSTVLTITGTGLAVGRTMTYTKPTADGAYKLRDLAGNEVATTTFVLV